jgi:hypothetical protein
MDKLFYLILRFFYVKKHVGKGCFFYLLKKFIRLLVTSPLVLLHCSIAYKYHNKNTPASQFFFPVEIIPPEFLHAELVYIGSRMEKERMESEGVNTKKSVDDRVFLITS